MTLSKFQRIILKIVFPGFLLTFPLFSKIYYTNFYYIMMVLLVAFLFFMEVFDWNEKLDERFYKRWSKVRKKGVWLNSINEGLRSLIFMIIVVSIGQFFGNGRTPMDIVNALSGSNLSTVLVLIIFINSIIGIVSWYENEKRYKRICLNRKKNY